MNKIPPHAFCANLGVWLAAALVSAGAISLQAQAGSPRPPNADGESDESNEVLALTPFSVVGTGNTGYGALMGTSGRLATPYLDTPQATSIVTSQLLADASLFSSNEALRYVPSLKGASNIFGKQSLRGLDTSNTYSDGFLNRGARMFDTAFVDRIEVIKGPSSTSFGRGDPAGFINYISKRPRFKAGTELGVMVGTGNDDTDTFRFTLDHNGILSKDQKTAYRFVALHTEGAETMALSQYRRDGAQLAVTHHLNGGRGSLDVIAAFMSSQDPSPFHGAEYTNETRKKVAIAYNRAISGVTYPDYNVLGDDNLPGLNGSSADRVTSRLTAILDYKLTDHWRTRQAVNLFHSKEDGLFGTKSGNVYLASNGTLMLNGIMFSLYDRSRQVSYQSDFLGQYDLPSIGAKVAMLAGADINVVDGASAQNRTSTAVVPQLFYNWNPAIKMGPLLANPAEVALATSGQNWSAYAQGQITLFKERVQLSAALRRIWQDTETVNRTNNALTTTKQHSPILPTYSLLVKPTKWLSVYGTASEHLEPAAVVAQYSQIPPAIPANDPRRSATINRQPKTTMYEVGAKASLWKERLTCSVTYYEAKAGGGTNNFSRTELASDGSSFTYIELIHQDDRVKGWEFEGFGQVTSRLSFLMGGNLGSDSVSKVPYNGQIVDALVYNLGDSVYGYATYNFGPSRYEGFSITGGWKTIFSGWAIRLSDPLRQVEPEDQHVADLGVSYGFKRKFEVYLKGTNIFNKGSLNLGDQSRISGRLIFAGVNARF